MPERLLRRLSPVPTYVGGPYTVWGLTCQKLWSDKCVPYSDVIRVRFGTEVCNSLVSQCTCFVQNLDLNRAVDGIVVQVCHCAWENNAVLVETRDRHLLS